MAERREEREDEQRKGGGSKTCIYIEEFEKYVGMRFELLTFGIGVQCLNCYTTASLNTCEEIGLYVFNCHCISIDCTVSRTENKENCPSNKAVCCQNYVLFR